MAILFDANTDVIYRTANIPVMNGGPYTVSFWFYLVTAPTAGDAYQSLFCININSSSEYDQVGLLRSGANTRLFVAVDNGTYHETVGGTNLSTDTWYHVLLVRSSTTSLVAYLDAVSEATQASTASTQTSTRMDFGVHPQFSTDDFKGRLAAIKIWDVALSAEERENERWTYAPARYGNLNLWNPCFAGSGERTQDYSGGGRTWTEGGTLTDADGPPLRWGFSPTVGYYLSGSSPVVVTPTPASASAAVVAPAVINPVSIAPAVASAQGASIAPTVLNMVSVAPANANAQGVVIAPTVVQGSISITPTEATATGALIAPVVLNAVTVAPSAVSAQGAAAAPAVINVVLVAPVAISATGAVVAPAVLNAISITPTPNAAQGVTVAPVVVLGSLTIAPTLASASASVVTPGVAMSGNTVTPSAATASAGAAAPSVLSPVTITPAPVWGTASVAGPAITSAVLIAPSSASANAGAVLGAASVSQNIAPPVTVSATAGRPGLSVSAGRPGLSAGSGQPIIAIVE